MNTVSTIFKLKDLPIDNSFVEALPADALLENYSRQVMDACYSKVLPKKFPKAKLLAFSDDLAAEIGLDPDECSSAEFVKIFSGTQPLEQMQPYASCYGGHQFGHWAGQLGDGRAINLGEIVSPHGQRWSLQLKGSGPTPYSRTADGLAVLRSSLREFLCSEAMHHLHVPTTRALSLIDTGEQVERDMFYDGHVKFEPGAVVCRVAPSFTRFGNFELLTARNDLTLLKRLADYTIRTNFAELVPASGIISTEQYCAWFQQICQLSAHMLVQWMRVGFVHGVMNTDNMSILGLTIDYGPYGWLEDYDPDWTPNTTDAQGKRYRFGQQPQIALWNLLQLGNALYPLIGASEPITEALEEYKTSYEDAWHEMMLSKLGLQPLHKTDDANLIQSLLAALQSTETDMTIFFRELSSVIDSMHELGSSTSPAALEIMLSPLRRAFYDTSIAPQARQLFNAWLLAYQQRLQQEVLPAAQRQQQMNAVNAKYVLRNYLAQLAIDKAEQGDLSLVEELVEVLKNPYTDQVGKDHLDEKRPEWARHRAGCSMLSCSS